MPHKERILCALRFSFVVLRRAGIACLILVLLAPSTAIAIRQTSGDAAAGARSTASSSYVYLPAIHKSGCAPIPGVSYGAVAPDPVIGIDPQNDYRINLALRGYTPVDELKAIFDIGTGSDPNAPQFRYLFADVRTPAISTVYALYRWDTTCNCPSTQIVTKPAVSVAGLATAPGEIIHLPDSGYEISPGYDAMVLYASQTRLVAKYTREDDIVAGYTLYLENICLEPSLLALYQALNAAGRQQLPALAGSQPVGRAIGTEIGISIRDAGRLQDPRARNAWWLYP
ncbi:MAG TPA: hypothetical protein VFL17_04715 [Anaerolineae bacterium]|nr:hypothetical protein [Anaerolineae bacterium]